MNDDRWNDGLDGLREEYNAPFETPREEIWDGIEAVLEQAPPEEMLETMREVYLRPPQAPRDEMWVAIEAELPAAREAGDIIAIDSGRPSTSLRKSVRSRQRTALATAAAALLIMGIGLGRLSMGRSGTPVEPADVAPGGAVSSPLALEEGPSADVGSNTMRAAAADHFSRTESLLTMVSSDARAGRVDAEVGEWARTLLLQTRLFMNSPAAQDPMILELIQDLEVVLMQVVRLSPQIDGSQAGELALITESLEDNDIMLRIRATLPVGSVQAGI